MAASTASLASRIVSILTGAPRRDRLRTKQTLAAEHACGLDHRLHLTPVRLGRLHRREHVIVRVDFLHCPPARRETALGHGRRRRSRFTRRSYDQAQYA